MDLELSPATTGKKNLSSDTYVKDNEDIANIEDFGTKVPVIIETLASNDGKVVSSIGSSNLAVRNKMWYYLYNLAIDYIIQYSRI